jgi:periplasmic protein TonB
MSSLAPFYRTYELPWSPTEEVESGFRRIARNCFIVFFALCILIQLLPLPDTKKAAPALPDRVVNLVLEQRKPPPPPKAVEPEKSKEEVKPKPAVKPEPVPESEKRIEQARAQANKAIQALTSDLDALRNSAVLNKVQQTDRLSGAVAETRSERSMITSAVGKGSGGINNAALSRGYGGSTGELAGHTTTAVANNLGVTGSQPGVQKGGDNKKASRSGEEIAQVFDANRSAIDALYARAVREKPDLQGKVVVKLTILPDGTVESCTIDSSTLGDEEFEKKLVARIKLFRFAASDVAKITVTKPLDFFPAG